MTRTTAPDISHLPALPHWDTRRRTCPPRSARSRPRLRARIAASGRSVERSSRVIEPRVRDRVDEIVAAKGRGEPVGRKSTTRTSRPVPVPAARSARCAGVAAWSCAGTSRANRRSPGIRASRLRREQPVLRELPGPGDDFFGSVGSRPEIYPIYWSPPADAGPPE